MRWKTRVRWWLSEVGHWIYEKLEPSTPKTYFRLPHTPDRPQMMAILKLTKAGQVEPMDGFSLPDDYVLRRSRLWPPFRYAYVVTSEPARNSDRHTAYITSPLIKAPDGSALTPHELGVMLADMLNQALTRDEPWWESTTIR